jgi:hypothetical protein
LWGSQSWLQPPLRRLFPSMPNCIDNKHMGLFEIAVGLFLFIFLVVLTLMINPPEAWARKWTKDRNDKR